MLDYEITCRVYELKYWKRTCFGAETIVKEFKTRADLLHFINKEAKLKKDKIIHIKQIREYKINEI